MLADLLAHPGVTELLELRSLGGVMALHGGLEPGTYEIAERLATETDASLYAVVMPADLAWHVPSIQYDPSGSQALTDFLSHVRFAVSIHGHHRPEFPNTVFLGGRNRDVAYRIADALRRRTDVSVCDDLDRIPQPLRGLDSRNPVNLAPMAGVQIELPPDARDDRSGEVFIAAVSAAIRAEARSIA